MEKALLYGLDKSSNVASELTMWRNKWVYDALRRELTNNVKIDESTALEYFNTHKNNYKTKNGMEPAFKEFQDMVKHDAYFDRTFKILDDKISQLKKDFHVKLNKELFDSVKVFDSQKSRWATTFLFKGNSKRMAIPIVDPSWGMRSKVE